jgi:DNA-binding NarL/FixJ family response regulator
VQDAKLLSSRVRVMLVEDSALIREALIDALALSAVAHFEGFATTANDAITALRAQPYDIIVIDIELAKGTGFDVLLNINQTDFPYKPPVSIVLTNHAYPVYKYQAELLGVKYFFDKSMHFIEAIEAIEQEAMRLLPAKTEAE